jgi:hypothetical protein
MLLMFFPNNMVDLNNNYLTPLLSFACVVTLYYFLGKARIEEFEDKNHSHEL